MMIATHLKAATLLGAGLLLLPMQSVQAAPKHTTARHAVHHRVDPTSVQALRNMSGYLRTLTDFEINSKTTREEIDPKGQKLQFTGAIDYQVRRPNGLVIKSSEDNRQRQLFYDGKFLTVFTPEKGYYAKVPAPPTIRETLKVAADRYDIHPPMVDLFKWGSGEDGAERLTSGRHVGVSNVNGTEADHYAFRQKGVDWQIWIARGSRPLPLRVVVTSTADRERPQFRADLNWNTNAQFADNTFVFQPPADAKQIGIASIR